MSSLSNINRNESAENVHCKNVLCWTNIFGPHFMLAYIVCQNYTRKPRLDFIFVAIFCILIFQTYHTKLSTILFYLFFLPLTPCLVIYLALSHNFLPLTYTLDQIAAALHVRMCTKAQLDFDRQLLSFNVYVSIKSLFTIEIIQLSVKSWKNPNEKFCQYRGWNLQPGICNSQSYLWYIYCWIALMYTQNQRLVALEEG